MTTDVFRSSRTRRPPRGSLVLRRGLYLPPSVAPSDLARATAAVTPFDGAVLIGLAAAWLLTEGRVDLPDPIPIAHRNHLRQPGARQLILAADERRLVRGLPCTSPARTAADLLRREQRLVAITAVDALLNRVATVTDEIAEHLKACRQRPGQARAIRLLAEVEPNAGSPRETLLRLTLIDGGLPRPVAQLIMLAPSGGFLGRADLGYALLRLAIEYLGRVHEHTLDGDWDRLAEMRDSGYECVGITAGSLRKPGEAVRRVLAGVRRQQRHLGIAGTFPWLA